MSFRRSGMSRIGGMLKPTLQGLGIQEKLLEQKAIAKWRSVVGKQIAASTTPESIREGTLFVCCKSSMWSSELSLHKADILRRLNEAVGKPVVKEIRFSARGFRKSAPDAPIPRAEMEQAVPLSPEALQAAEEVASECSSEELAEKVRRAIISSKLRRTDDST